MASRKLRKSKKGIGGRLIGFFLGLAIIIAIILFGLVMLGRYVIESSSNNIISKVIPYSQSLTDASGKIASASPEAIVSTLNGNASSIVDRSQGFIDSAQATTDGQTVEYKVSSSKLNGLLANGLLATNGDQIEDIANKVLDSMKSAGVEQPQLVLKLTDSQGQLIKTVNYK
ncbi:hypothetical protein [Lactococcus garvieae]|uniref:hypothetical protein n=1 Tax=Lactococcus garvieae TaxID=1363 RepID=UPI0018D74713|nr:hypothetical protein [Lactococcus garvieae]QPS71706.1 hypothetical protein I6G50_03295 [Lactococcus garvieae]